MTESSLTGSPATGSSITGEAKPTLASLLAGLKAELSFASGITLEDINTKNINIDGITTDPALCRNNSLYVAVESETVDSTRYGVYLDGRHYIEQAIANGATAILTDSEHKVSAELEHKAIFIYHQRPLAVLGLLCARFFNETRPQHIALVTGTNGKTSTVNFAKMLWQATGHIACSVGNLGGVCSDDSVVWERDVTLSVPETVTLHKLLKTLAERKVNHVALEATSHALHDYRLHGVPATIGAFSNLTRDHLDFHDGMEDYFQQKMKLFNAVMPQGSTAVLNADAEYYERAVEVCRQHNHRIISYGKAGSDIRLLNSSETATGQHITLSIFGKEYSADFNLYGLFQLSNALCALGIVIASGVSPEQAINQFHTLKPVEGRLNIIATTPSGGRVVIDYAHTPDGLLAALEACRTFTKGKLYVVFGCDGERDTGKRAEMAMEADKASDIVVITDGFARGEDPEIIRKQVMEGAPNAIEIAPRSKAIDFAIRALGPTDTVLIAGTLDAKQLDYTDRATALEVVRQINKEQSIKSSR